MNIDTTEKVSAAYGRLKQERNQLAERLRMLDVQIATLEMVGAGHNGESAPALGVDTPMPPNRVKSQGAGAIRAPVGELKKQILAALKANGKPMTNHELRTYLESHGYKWSLTPLHVSKTLTGLVREKKIKGEGSIVNRRYRLA